MLPEQKVREINHIDFSTEPESSFYQLVGKRFLDICFSFMGMIVLIPLFVLIALLIKLESEGPVIFKQRRIGIHNNEFTIYKFRTMRKGGIPRFPASAFFFDWLQKGLFFIWERFCAPRADYLVTINDDDFAVAKRWRLGKQVLRLPGVGINLSRFEKVKTGEAVTSEAEVAASNEAMADSKPVTVGFIGELNKNKRPLDFVKMASLLMGRDFRRECGQIRFYLAGDGSLRSTVEKEIQETGLGDVMKVRGWHDDIPSLLTETDILVHMSMREGLPTVVLEAMSIGLPVVASEVRGCVDLVSDGQTGFLLLVGRPELFAEKEPSW